MKTYPLELQRWGEDGEEIVSKGHHPPCVFLRRAIREALRDSREDDWADEVARQEMRELLAKLRHGDVRHEWYRHSVSRDLGEGTEWEGMRFFTRVDGPGLGAFPVTLVRLW